MNITCTNSQKENFSHLQNLRDKDTTKVKAKKQAKPAEAFCNHVHFHFLTDLVNLYFCFRILAINCTANLRHEVGIIDAQNYASAELGLFLILPWASDTTQYPHPYSTLIFFRFFSLISKAILI